MEDPADAVDTEPPADIKIILLGDSAVGKTKLVERFLMGDYHPRQLSTFALTLFRYNTKVEDRDVAIGEQMKRVGEGWGA